MTRGPVVAVLLGAAACAGAGGAQGDGGGHVATRRPLPPDAVTGCYQFAWNEEAAMLGLPWGFELLERPLEGWPGLPDARVARTRVTEEIVRDHPFAYWRPLAGDSIRVGHPGGGGFSLTLRPDGPDLAGEARSVGDAVAPGEEFFPRPARPVTARRVVCPSPEAPHRPIR